MSSRQSSGGSNDQENADRRHNFDPSQHPRGDDGNFVPKSEGDQDQSGQRGGSNQGGRRSGSQEGGQGGKGGRESEDRRHEFDPSEHPRGPDGKFITKSEGGDQHGGDQSGGQGRRSGSQENIGGQQDRRSGGGNGGNERGRESQDRRHEFDPSEHPRGPDGKFIPKSEAEEGDHQPRGQSGGQGRRSQEGRESEDRRHEFHPSEHPRGADGKFVPKSEAEGGQEGGEGRQSGQGGQDQSGGQGEGRLSGGSEGDQQRYEEAKQHMAEAAREMAKMRLRDESGRFISENNQQAA